MGYLELPAESRDILSGIEKLSPLGEEIRLIKQVKDHVQCGRIAKALSKLKELHKRSALQFQPFREVEKNDVLAFINYESAIFYRIVYDHIATVNYLKIAKLLASSPEMNLLVDYQIATLEAERNNDIRILTQFAKIFHKELFPVLEVMAYFRMGEILAGLKDFDGAHRKFRRSEEITQTIRSESLALTSKSNLGFLYYLEKKYPEALEVLTSLSDSGDSFQKSLILENIALVYEALGEYDNALSFWLKSLNLCQDHGILMNIPEDALHIGEIYEDHLGSASQAKFFYKLGYEQSMIIFRDGINISETMRAVIEKYISYFTEYYIPDSKTQLHPKNFTFSFALEKSWKEICNLFAYNLIVYHKYHSHSVNEMLEKLALKRSNFQAKQQKLTSAGFSIPDFRKNIHNQDDRNILDSIQHYVEYFKDFTWNEITRQFEKDVMKYLVSHYGSKREDLLKKLRISYPNLKKKLNVIQSAR